MVVAIFSDVHSNLESLEGFVNETYGKVDRYICLGDIVGYGPDPNVCVNIVKSLCGTEWAIRGNHDRALLDPQRTSEFNFVAAEAIFWTLNRVSESELDYLRKLSDIIDYDSYIFVHGGLTDLDEYIISLSSAKRNLNKLENVGKKIMFFGHTHIPAMWSSKGFHEVPFDRPIYLDNDSIYLINPGALGQPRDNIPLGAYLLFNTTENFVIFKRFEYDVEKTYRKIVNRGLPEYLGRRLKFGV
ncbi:MAG: metallophosphoesterase family protein [Brevinematia bacterium]